jgi:hypothetical protein
MIEGTQLLLLLPSKVFKRSFHHLESNKKFKMAPWLNLLYHRWRRTRPQEMNTRETHPEVGPSRTRPEGIPESGPSRTRPQEMSTRDPDPEVGQSRTRPEGIPEGGPSRTRPQGMIATSPEEGPRGTNPEDVAGTNPERGHQRIFSEGSPRTRPEESLVGTFPEARHLASSGRKKIPRDSATKKVTTRKQAADRKKPPVCKKKVPKKGRTAKKSKGQKGKRDRQRQGTVERAMFSSVANEDLLDPVKTANLAVRWEDEETDDESDSDPELPTLSGRGSGYDNDDSDPESDINSKSDKQPVEDAQDLANKRNGARVQSANLQDRELMGKYLPSNIEDLFGVRIAGPDDNFVALDECSSKSNWCAKRSARFHPDQTSNLTADQRASKRTQPYSKATASISEVL